MDDSNIFESPKDLIDESRDSIEQIHGFSNDFMMSNLPEEIKRINEESGRLLMGFKFSKEKPKKVKVHASRILNDLRNALDQAVFIASRAINPNCGKQTYFPFCESPQDFYTLFVPRKGRCRDVPEQIRPFLLSLEPYPTSASHNGGDDLLRALSKVSGRNKHQFTIGVSYDPRMINLYNVDKQECRYIGEFYNSRELIILESPKKPKNDIHIGCTFYLSFDEGSGLSGGPVSSILRDLAERVEKSVKNIEVETMRILAGQ